MMNNFIYVIRLKPFGNFLKSCYFDLNDSEQEDLYVIDDRSILSAQRFTTQESVETCCEVLREFGYGCDYLKFKA